MKVRTPNLPSLPKLNRPVARSTRDRVLPVAIAAGLVAAGAALWKIRPSALDMPDPMPLSDKSDHSRISRAARKSRDGVALIAPDNLSVSLGRSLVIAGAALLATRALDELSSRD